MHPFNWKPVRQSFINAGELADAVYTDGYKIIDFLTEAELKQLDELYSRLHKIEVKDGGMFYSVYSKDVLYRKQVQDGVNEILTGAFNRYLHNYRTVLNAFVIKAPGKKSEFGIHQDSTGLDEFKHSPLSIWIPLSDITEQNGAMCIIPGSHHLFSPYRGISFPAPYEKIQGTVKKYLRPLYLQRGQAVFFDNRVVHNSMNNLTDKNRVVVVASIFPKDAELVTCFKNDTGSHAGQIELIGHSDDFLLEYGQFLENCHVKPDRGTTLAYVEDKFPLLTGAQFEELMQANGIRPYEGPNLFTSNESCNMIAEPVTELQPLP